MQGVVVLKRCFFILITSNVLIAQPVFGFCALGFGNSCDDEEKISLEKIARGFQTTLSFAMGDLEESQSQNQSQDTAVLFRGLKEAQDQFDSEEREKYQEDTLNTVQRDYKKHFTLNLNTKVSK